MVRTGAVGRYGRTVAGLLVLVLLALSAAPPVAMAGPPAGHGHPHAVQDWLSPDNDTDLVAEAPLPSDPGQRGGHHGPTPGLACCVALQCPMLPGGLPAVAE